MRIRTSEIVRPPKMPGVYLTIYACHWLTPCIDVIEADGTPSFGTRVLVSKCCPKQYSKIVACWRITEQQAEELHDELLSALERAAE